MNVKERWPSPPPAPAVSAALCAPGSHARGRGVNQDAASRPSRREREGSAGCVSKAPRRHRHHGAAATALAYDSLIICGQEDDRRRASRGSWQRWASDGSGSLASLDG